MPVGVAGTVAIEAAKLGVKAVESGAMSQAARMQRKQVMGNAWKLRQGKLGYSDPARAALLRGGQQQAMVNMQAAQAQIAQQQAAAGGMAGGGYANAQRVVAQTAQDAAAQNAANVNAQSDELAANQRKDYQEGIDAQAARARTAWQAQAGSLLDAGTAVRTAYKRPVEGEKDFANMKSWGAR